MPTDSGAFRSQFCGRAIAAPLPDTGPDAAASEVELAATREDDVLRLTKAATAQAIAAELTGKLTRKTGPDLGHLG